ncbi:MAG: ABC transporter permease [Limnohabitans sp.]|nr:ABC transporter permease [Limnohabitans sp.]
MTLSQNFVLVRGVRASLRRVSAVASREVRSAFVSPIGWIVLSLAGLVAAVVFFASTFEDARPATLRSAILAAGWALLVTAPAIAMRSFAEEFRLKSWETLFASPLGPLEMVAGKALGCALLVAASLIPVALLTIPLEWYASPDYGEVLCGLVGLFLAGWAASAMTLAVSAATASQTVAFLGGFFAWLGLVAGSRLLVGALPVALAPYAAACDPLRRLEGFALGLFDTAGVAYFLAIVVCACLTATVLLERIRDHTSADRVGRLLARCEGMVFLASSTLASVLLVLLFSQAPLRSEFDATKTRAYSLAPSTRSLIEGLEGPWKVLLFVDEARADLAVLRQIDEVLERFQDANPAVDARRIDPTNPAFAGQFEKELAEIVASRASDVARSEEAIARALSTFDAFRADAGSQPAGLRAAAQQLGDAPANASMRRTVEQLAGFFAQVSTDGDAFRSKVTEFTKTSATRPLPDIEGARSALARGFRTWGDQLAAAATLFASWRAQPSLPQSVKAVLASRITPFEEMASRMQASRQELEALPALEFDALGRELLGGEAAVVVGGGRIAVIPAWRLFPTTTASRGTELVSYSWGVRGEEVLSGAIRSISSGSMPEVVFVHSERDALLKPAQDHSDVVAVADTLRSAGFGVREWTPGRGDRPTATRGIPQIFVVLPALRRAQLDLSREEKLVVDATEELLAEGAPVLLTAGRSLLQLLGQPDPWEEILAPFGLRADAGKVVLELFAGADGAPTARPWQLIERVPESPLATRLRGRPILFNQPMRISTDDSAPADVTRTTIVDIESDDTRWLADDWRGDGDGIREVPSSKRWSGSLPVVVVAERRHEGRAQRVALVASGGWLLTSVSDLSDSLGGGRTALVNPGNRELLLALVAWLADRPDLFEEGISGREVPRLASLTEGARTAWMIVFGSMLAVGPLAMGGVIMARRGRRS